MNNVHNDLTKCIGVYDTESIYIVSFVPLYNLSYGCKRGWNDKVYRNECFAISITFNEFQNVFGTKWQSVETCQRDPIGFQTFTVGLCSN
jgi:hypothetical protein